MPITGVPALEHLARVERAERAERVEWVEWAELRPALSTLQIKPFKET